MRRESVLSLFPFVCCLCSQTMSFKVPVFTRWTTPIPSPRESSSFMGCPLGAVLLSEIPDKARAWGGSGRSFANISLHSPLAFFAGHVATPVVFAMAPLHDFVHVRVVPTTAAHQVAAVTAIGGFIALSGNKERRVNQRWLNATVPQQ